ncbi:hypothetical protein JNB63_03065 [Microbacterium trichothecenolyticum]|uniref:hypothetical protein n=1 Tax=Microbacterium trichothecenolyticum TaxID=69370 RepID=UPI001C6E466C|nr:hypothetical protein [Microbacterium trichothecenolyticum]MBW9119064.1 hypothetical protein [Microbacterium trichothecenolyticum]
MPGVISEAYGLNIGLEQQLGVVASIPSDQKIGDVKGCGFRRDRAERAFITAH